MNLIEEIEQNIDVKKSKLPYHLWNSLLLISRLRFLQFYKYIGKEGELKLEALQETKPTIKNYLAIIKMVVKYTLISLMVKRKKKEIMQELGKKPSYIIKSFLYTNSVKEKKFDDPFWKSFTYYAAENNKNQLIIVEPVNPWSLIPKNILKCELNLLPWFSFLSFSDYFKAALTQISQYFLFQSPETLWQMEMKQEILHQSTFQNLLYYYAFSRLGRELNCEKIYFTFENNSWEKVGVQAFRECSPKTKIIGYQHSVVPESALGLYFLDWELRLKNLPDKIFTTGTETEKIIKHFNQESSIPIEALCALRYEYLFKLPSRDVQLGKKILVAIEAVFDAYLMINEVIKCKQFFQDKGYEINFRFHPALPFEAYSEKISIEELLSFSSISKQSLEKDLGEASIILYWGSTVALEGLFIGLPLINFRSDFPLSHDPLFHCQELKWEFKFYTELPNIIYEIENLSLSDLNQKRLKARDYLKRYFIEPKTEHLQKLLEA